LEPRKGDRGASHEPPVLFFEVVIPLRECGLHGRVRFMGFDAIGEPPGGGSGPRGPPWGVEITSARPYERAILRAPLWCLSLISDHRAVDARRPIAPHRPREIESLYPRRRRRTAPGWGEWARRSHRTAHLDRSRSTFWPARPVGGVPCQDAHRSVWRHQMSCEASQGYAQEV